MSSSDRALDVLYSFGPPAEDANPYVHLLLESVAPGAKVHYFNWKYALLGKYDAFHVHWPETLLRRPSLKGRVACRVFLTALLAKLALTRTPIIRTEHNLRPHEAGSRIESLLLDLLDRQTAAWVVMTGAGSRGPASKLRLIPHGHYKDWYKLDSAPAKKSGSVLNFGLIRPYKGVEDLVDAFAALPAGAGLDLTIMGKPQSQQSATDLRERIAGKHGITADLRHVPDDELARAVAEAELVVLPYHAMHNSGALLLALSLGTAVLVPKNVTTDALAAEVGEQWVCRYEGPITPESIMAASAAARNLAGAPDLSGREWPDIGAQHIETYRTGAL